MSNQELSQSEINEGLKNFTGWYAPSMFVEKCGNVGYLVEVKAYYFFRGVQRSDIASHSQTFFSVECRDPRQGIKQFWKEWNQEHKGKELFIGKVMN